MAARVLILNCFVKGWNVLKRLADDGFEVNGADHRPGAPGLFSNRINDPTRNLIYPDPKVDEKRFIETVLEFVSRKKFDILLPVNAAEMMALARCRNELIKHTLFPFEDYYKLLLLHDKKYFFELLAGNVDDNLIPKTWSIGNQTPPISDIIGLCRLDKIAYHPLEDFKSVDHFLNSNLGLVYPLIVKTRRSTSSVGVFRVGDESDLRRACAHLDEADIIVQENLVGRGVGISSIRWNHPDLIYHFGHKRVREYPISGGASTSREPWACQDNFLTKSLTDLLNRLNWQGVVMFEFKEVLSAKNRFEYKFLEANPRFWGSVPLAMANGINFPALLCRAALGMDIPEVDIRNDTRARILFSDSLSLVLNIARGRRVAYNLFDYFNFRKLFLDDIDLHDLPATSRICRQMLTEFFARR